MHRLGRRSRRRRGAWEGGVEAFVTVGVTRAAREAGRGGGRGDVEQESEVGVEGEKARQGRNQGPVSALAVALVGHGGVGEAVTDDDGAESQGRKDRSGQVLGAGGEVEIGFGGGGPGGGAAQQEVAE